MTDTDAKLTKNMHKVRKGATAGLSAKQFCDVLVAVGFEVEEYRRDDRSKGYMITAPGDAAEPYDLHKEPNRTRIVLYGRHGVEAWAKSHELIDLVCAELGLDTVEAERAAKTDTKNKSERRATCPCCFGAYKYGKDGRMVHHGYERPGYGYTVGKCYAAREFQPFEISPKGTVYMLTLVETARLDNRELLARLKAEPDTLRKLIHKSRGKVEYVIINKGDVDYNSHLRSRVREVEYSLKNIESDVATLEAKLDNWQPQELEGYPNAVTA